MAKRTRKQRERLVVRRPTGAGAAPPGAAVPGAAVEDLDASAMQPLGPMPGAAPAMGAPRRRVQRVGAAPSVATTPQPAGSAATLAGVGAVRRPQRQPAGFIEPLEGDDPAIPFDRVPYVPADLRRVAIIATIMIALIIVADIIVNNVVK